MKACSINRNNGEFLAWTNKGIRYALIKREGKIYDQAGRMISSTITARDAISAAMA